MYNTHRCALGMNEKQKQKTMVPVLYIANLLLLMVGPSSAFSVPTAGGGTRYCRGNLSLFAKAAKNKKKSKPQTSRSGGGFGKIADATPKVMDDYAVFPALEPKVEDTLIPSPPELQEVGSLPVEVYDRLDKIYGFPNFNFHKVDPNDSEGRSSSNMSFDDLISASTASETSSTTSMASSQAMSDMDFASLLASATGEDSSPAVKATANVDAVVDSKMEAIASLPQFSDFRVLHVDPLVLTIDDFFTDEECDRYVAMQSNPTSQNGGDSSSYETRSKTVGKDNQAKAQRTSTTWFHHYKNVPELMSKASRLLGLDGINHWEEAQIVRYRRNEKFTWHLDALAPGAESAPSLGGQRTATLLVYLTNLSVSDGGATIFRDLSGAGGDGSTSDSDAKEVLKVQPKKGSALLFFPAAGGIPNTPFDIRTLHCGEVVDDSSTQDKWISQLWLRETPYTPSAPPGNQHELARTAIAEYCGRNNNN